MESESLTPDTAALLAEVDWVHRLARALLQDPDLAADAAQDTLTAALQRPPTFASDRFRLRNWLARVTRNRVARTLRERRMPGSQCMERSRSAVEPAEENHGAAAVVRIQLHRQVVDAVLELHEPYRSTVVMRFFDGLSTKEIAARKQAETAAIRQQISRGLNRLRVALDQRFGSRDVWCAALLGVPAVVRTPAAIFTLTWSSVLMLKWILAVSVLAAAVLWWIAPDLESPTDVAKAPAGGVDSASQPPGDEKQAEESTQRAKLADAARVGNSDSGAAAQPPALRIRVIDETNDARVPGVGVFVREVPRHGPNGPQRRLQADPQGKVLVEGLRPGRATVTTNRGMGYRVVEVLADVVTDVTITMKGGIALSGVVVDAGGTHVADATVLICRRPGGTPTRITRTDGNGRFAIRPLPAWMWVGARARDHAPSPLRRIIAGAGAEIDVRIVLPGVGGNIAGRVLDPAGNGVADALVKIGEKPPRGRPITLPDGSAGLHPPPALERTDADGRFTADGAKPGLAPVTVETAGYAPWSGEVEVVAHTTRPLEIRLTQGVAVGGTVRDENGEVLAGVEVQQGDFDTIELRLTRTERDGSYSLVGLPAGKPLVIHVRNEKHGDATHRLEGVDGETLRCDIALSRGVVLAGRVLGRDGKPLPKARIHAEGPRVTGQPTWFRDATTDEDGQFEAIACPAGPVIGIWVSAQGYLELHRPGVDASTGPFELQMHYEGEPTARIVGRLVDPEGKPVQNALIHVGRDGGGGGSVYTTNANGAIRIEKLRPGLLTVRIRAGTHAGYVSEERAIARDETWDLGPVQLRHGGRLRVDLQRPPGTEKERIHVHIYRGSLWLSGFGTGKRILMSAPLTPDDYHLELHGPKVVPIRIPFRIRAGKQTDVRATPTFGTPCKFEMTLPAGSEGVTVVNYEIRGAGGFTYRSRRARRPSELLVVETGLPPGAYSIQADSTAGHTARREFQVSAGREPEPMRLDLR